MGISVGLSLIITRSPTSSFWTHRWAYLNQVPLFVPSARTIMGITLSFALRWDARTLRDQPSAFELKRWSE